MAGALIGAVPVAIVYAFSLDHFIHGLTAGALKWQPSLTPKEEKADDADSLDVSSSVPPQRGAAVAAPHVWVQPAAGRRQRALDPALEPLRPGLRQVVRPVGPGVGGQEQRQADDRPRPAPATSRPKIAAEVATQSGHDIVQMAGTGTEKFAPALIDVQDLADKLGKKYGGWTPLGAKLLEVKGRFCTDSRLLHRLPRPLPQGSLDRDRHAERTRHLGRAASRRRQAQGQGLPASGSVWPTTTTPRNSWRAIMWCYGGSEVAKDGKTITYNSKEVREASSSTRRSTRRR